MKVESKSTTLPKENKSRKNIKAKTKMAKSIFENIINSNDKDNTSEEDKNVYEPTDKDLNEANIRIKRALGKRITTKKNIHFKTEGISDEETYSKIFSPDNKNHIERSNKKGKTINGTCISIKALTIQSKSINSKEEKTIKTVTFKSNKHLKIKQVTDMSKGQQFIKSSRNLVKKLNESNDNPSKYDDEKSELIKNIIRSDPKGSKLKFLKVSNNRLGKYDEDEQNNEEKDDDDLEDSVGNITKSIIIELENNRRKLKKCFQVYDSLDDEEEDYLNSQSMKFMIDLDSDFKITWDYLITVALFYSMLIVTYSITLKESVIAIMVLSCIVEVIFMIDIILSFLIPYYSFDDALIKNHRKISINYLKGYFINDLICAIPFNIIRVLLANEIWAINFNWLDLLKTLKLLKWLGLSRRVDKKSEERTLLNKIIYLIKFNFWFFVCTHITSCLWLYLGNTTSESWVSQNYFVDNSNFNNYINALYFHWQTIFTVGYGDVRNTLYSERIYNIFLMLVGIAAYSYTVTSMGSLLSEESLVTKKYNKNMDTLKEIKSKLNPSHDIFNKIQKYLYYDYTHNTSERFKFVEELPRNTMKDLLLNMHRKTITNLNFISNCSNEEFIVNVVLCMRPLRLLKNERLFEENEIVEEMYMVTNGVLYLLLGEKYDYLKIMEVRKNEHFGDILCFSNQRTPYCLKVASKYVDLLLIRKEDLKTISELFPETYETIFNISKYNHYVMLEITETKKAKYLFEKQSIFHFENSKVFSKNPTMLENQNSVNMQNLPQKSEISRTFNESELQTKKTLALNFGTNKTSVFAFNEDRVETKKRTQSMDIYRKLLPKNSKAIETHTVVLENINKFNKTNNKFINEINLIESRKSINTNVTSTDNRKVNLLNSEINIINPKNYMTFIPESRINEDDKEVIGKAIDSDMTLTPILEKKFFRKCISNTNLKKYRPLNDNSIEEIKNNIPKLSPNKSKNLNEDKQCSNVSMLNKLLNSFFKLSKALGKEKEYIEDFTKKSKNDQVNAPDDIIY